MMRIKSQMPDWHKPGCSVITYECTECPYVLVQTRDNRFV
jgi:hypothetical protein